MPAAANGTSPLASGYWNTTCARAFQIFAEPSGPVPLTSIPFVDAVMSDPSALDAPVGVEVIRVANAELGRDAPQLGARLAGELRDIVELVVVVRDEAAEEQPDLAEALLLVAELVRRRCGRADRGIIRFGRRHARREQQCA